MISLLRRAYANREFKALFIVVVTTLIVGMVFYNRVEHWKLFDALYFSATVSTAGYGNLIPQTGIGKLFTMFYIFFGLGVILAFINVIAKHTTNNYTRLTENYLKRSEEYFEGVIEKALHKKDK